MRVLIYGGGSVGLGLASCLIRTGSEVDIIARADTVAALRNDGLVRTGIFGDVRIEPARFRAGSGMEELSGGPYDQVLVCTKSFDSEPAAQDLAQHEARIGRQAVFVLFQNGWGNVDAFTAHFDRARVYSARVITGFHRHRPNEVEITVHADAIHIGSLFGAELSGMEPLCRAIEEGGIPCRRTDAIEKDLWAKMLYNCALNPLGAILGVPYGGLAAQASTRSLMNHIIREVFAVMSAAGYRTHWEEPEAFLDAFYSRLVPDTAGHRSSTLQDLAAGKRTEIDALNGAVIRLAEEQGVPVPHNHAVYSLIKFLESNGR